MDNLLLMALTLIPPQDISFQKFERNETNSIGLNIPIYSEIMKLKGSIQKVDGSVYHQLGLDLQKNYRKVWLPANVTGIDSAVSCDRIIFSNKTWNVVKQDDWFEYNGWVSLLVVEDKSYD